MTVSEYVNSYEFRGDGADYTPTENERAMLEDAIEGYLSSAAEAAKMNGGNDVAR